MKYRAHTGGTDSSELQFSGAKTGVLTVGAETSCMMLTGKRFRMGRGTLSVESIDGKRTAVTVPTGAIIEVLSGPKNNDGLVKISWEGRALEMFAVDVDVRGTEIEDLGASA